MDHTSEALKWTHMYGYTYVHTFARTGKNEANRMKRWKRMRQIKYYTRSDTQWHWVSLLNLFCWLYRDIYWNNIENMLSCTTKAIVYGPFSMTLYDSQNVFHLFSFNVFVPCLKNLLRVLCRDRHLPAFFEWIIFLVCGILRNFDRVHRIL